MSLFARTIGKVSLEIAPIGIHRIQSLMSELDRGRLQFADVVSELELSDDEQSDLVRLLGFINSASDKLKFSNRVFNYLCLGELRVTTGRDYTDEALFWSMLEEETTNQ